MYQFLDFNTAHYLDALREDYAAQGYDVAYLPFTYTADFLPLAASATQTTTVTIDHDSDFILGKQTMTVFDGDGAGIEFPNFLARLIVETSQRQLQNRLTHALNLFGSAQRPNIYYKPLVLAAKSTFTVEAQDLSGADATIRLAFAGVKAFLRRAA